jgi:beta-phosphoglucomutase-like phosphatase (HAD superfamily)
MGVPPERCLAFEDSIPGLISAKDAGMRVVAVPDPAIADHPSLTRADLVLRSLTELSEEKWRDLEVIA